MKPVKSTYEILAYKVLNRSVDKKWTDWATEMLQTGFETESLIILAGESEPFNQFEMQSLTTKVLDELHFDYSDKEKVIKSYVSYLIDESLSGRIKPKRVLMELKDLYNELNQEKYLQDFWLLYFAKVDLEETTVQWYWEGAHHGNIDQIIDDHFKKWLADNQPELKITTA
jgi:hypothetical protein